MRCRAVKDGDHWVINGRKIWVSRVPKAASGFVSATVRHVFTQPNHKSATEALAKAVALLRDVEGR